MEDKSWECFSCKEKQIRGSFFLQVDAVEKDKILLSNYYEQRFLKYIGDKPPLNASYCQKCVDQMPGLQNQFEKEINNYTFEMNGKTCWNMDKQKSYVRECGSCDGCNAQLTLRSLYIENKYFFLLWSPHLASSCFPDPGVTQVWKLENPSKFYTQKDKPLFICSDCFKKEEWKPRDGPITCPLCDKKYNRWIFHHAMDPVKEGSGCYCHVYQDSIMDSYIDPEEYEWVSEKRPENFDSNKPFCYKCLDKLVQDGFLQSTWETCSSESGTMNPDSL